MEISKDDKMKVSKVNEKNEHKYTDLSKEEIDILTLVRKALKLFDNVNILPCGYCDSKEIMSGEEKAKHHKNCEDRHNIRRVFALNILKSHKKHNSVKVYDESRIIDMILV